MEQVPMRACVPDRVTTNARDWSDVTNFAIWQVPLCSNTEFR